MLEKMAGQVKQFLIIKDRWRPLSLTVLLLICLLALSDSSLYRIRGVSDITLEIALMLTPYGIIHNLVLDRDHWLRPYYYEPAERHGLFDDMAMRLWLGGLLISAILLLLVLYRRANSVSRREKP